MTFTCQDSRPLISSYADGELSETQAGLLRKHLLECSACRLAAQDERVLKRWFVQSEAIAVPADFASRVARRAFAGDTGQPELAAPVAARPEQAPQLPQAGGGKVYDFVLQLTAVAAAATIVFVLAIARSERPEGPMWADEQNPTLEDLRERLDELNQSDDADQLTEATVDERE